VVNDEGFDWGNDRPPAIPLADSILYEVHVKGATRLHPDVPEALRGTYAGLASPAMLEHFRRLGITAVNLLPVHYFLDEKHLVASGRGNYWGYNTLGFFAPEPSYAARCNGQSVIAEFRSMVRTLHAAGLEVILDVVFNHTAESDENGPTVSFRGIDNASYYRLPAENRNGYENFSGCGNTLNLANPRVLQLVMDALRYWVGEMHVDGFRFDLAATLTRDSGFLTAVRQDPLLARVKMIAEPWDLGPDGYQLGRFPAGWSAGDDNGATGGRFTWARRDCRAFGGRFGGWAVGGGANGTGLGCGSNYPNNAQSRMTYGPFSLAGATAAQLRFKLWLQSELNYDGLCTLASLNGRDFYGSCASGNSNGWIDRSFNLNTVYRLGNLVGQSRVWVAFAFLSDTSVTRAEGAHIDEVQLLKCPSTCNSAAQAPDRSMLIIAPAPLKHARRAPPSPVRGRRTAGARP